MEQKLTFDGLLLLFASIHFMLKKELYAKEKDLPLYQVF